MRNVYDLAKMEIGTYEWAEGSNPRVDAYFDDVGFPAMRDDTAWCAAFVGAMLKRSGYPHTGKLTARSYIDWGKPVDLKDAQPVTWWCSGGGRRIAGRGMLRSSTGTRAG
jgi:hypothetical protein